MNRLTQLVNGKYYISGELATSDKSVEEIFDLVIQKLGMYESLSEFEIERKKQNGGK